MACPGRHGSTSEKAPVQISAPKQLFRLRFYKFSQYLQETAGILMKTGYERLLLQSFIFISGIIIVTQLNVRNRI